MAIGSKEIVGYIKKIPIHMRRASRGCVRDHPFILCIVCFLLIIYRYFPSIFALLLASFPTILCTAVLLGLLLSYGEPNVPETKEEGKRLVNGEAKDASLVRKHHEGALVASRSEKKSVREKDDHGFSRKNENIPSEIGEDQKKSGKPKVEVEIDHVDHREAASDCEPDQSEISSSDASEIIPMLDELHPLLDSEAPQPSAASKDGSDAASTQSSHDRESEDGNSIEEETENQEDDDEEDEDEEEEEGAQEEKDDDHAKVVEWTADDQKNLMSVGSSEIERNQRLENLIARRRARKFVRSEMEKNLIDLDGNESLPTIEELSKFQVQIPQVFAPRRNPFDLPFDSDDTIPGSAPSVLLPSRNPFDLPYEQADESNNPAGKDDDNNNNNNNSNNNNSTHQGFVPLPPRDLLYRRHESFTIGESFLGDLKQDLRPSRFRPYFVAEKENTEETNFADLEREFSEKSESKLSEGQEYSDTVSSGNDQECDKEIVEDEVNSQQSELATSHDNEAPKVESESSDDGESMHDEQIKAEIKSAGSGGDNSKAMEEEITEESASISSISDDEKAVVTEDNNLKQPGDNNL